MPEGSVLRDVYCYFKLYPILEGKKGCDGHSVHFSNENGGRYNLLSKLLCS